jgi:peroxiredoxin
MVSLDEADKNKQFADSVGANFVLLSDPGKQNAERYGVLAFGGLYTKRWTFYIDGQGILRKIDKNVDPDTAGQDVAATLTELGIGR